MMRYWVLDIHRIKNQFKLYSLLVRRVHIQQNKGLNLDVLATHILTKQPFKHLPLK